MVTAAAVLAALMIFKNATKAGPLWGSLATAAKSLILITPGPMFAAMPALFVFRSFSKSRGKGGGGLVNSTPAQQPNFL